MRRTPIAVLTVILSIGLSARTAAPAQAPEKTHPLTIHDMLAMDRISDSKVSPDGKWIVFNVRQTDLEANRGRTDLWLVGTDGKGLRRLTNHPAADFNGRWTPCGQWVFFLSTRSGSSQVWRIKVDGGEAEQVTHLPLDVGSLVLTKGSAGRHHGGLPRHDPRRDGRQSSTRSKRAKPPAVSTRSSSSAIGTPGAMAAARTSSPSRCTGTAKPRT